jgi:hypothetical protein
MTRDGLRLCRGSRDDGQRLARCANHSTLWNTAVGGRSLRVAAAGGARHYGPARSELASELYARDPTALSQRLSPGQQRSPLRLAGCLHPNRALSAWLDHHASDVNLA